MSDLSPEAKAIFEAAKADPWLILEPARELAKAKFPELVFADDQLKFCANKVFERKEQFVKLIKRLQVYSEAYLYWVEHWKIYRMIHLELLERIKELRQIKDTLSSLVNPFLSGDVGYVKAVLVENPGLGVRLN